MTAMPLRNMKLHCPKVAFNEVRDKDIVILETKREHSHLIYILELGSNPPPDALSFATAYLQHLTHRTWPNTNSYHPTLKTRNQTLLV